MLYVYKTIYFCQFWNEASSNVHILEDIVTFELFFFAVMSLLKLGS